MLPVWNPVSVILRRIQDAGFPWNAGGGKTSLGSDDLSGKVVSVQGCGHVGYFLCKELHQVGARLIVTDVDDTRVKTIVDQFEATAVNPTTFTASRLISFHLARLGYHQTIRQYRS